MEPFHHGVSEKCTRQCRLLLLRHLNAHPTVNQHEIAMQQHITHANHHDVPSVAGPMKHVAAPLAHSVGVAWSVPAGVNLAVSILRPVASCAMGDHPLDAMTYPSTQRPRGFHRVAYGLADAGLSYVIVADEVGQSGYVPRERADHRHPLHVSLRRSHEPASPAWSGGTRKNDERRIFSKKSPLRCPAVFAREMNPARCKNFINYNHQ